MKVDPKRRVDYEGITTCSSGRSFLKPPTGAMSPASPGLYGGGSLLGPEPLYHRQRTQPVRSSISSARAQVAASGGANSSVQSYRSSKQQVGASWSEQSVQAVGEAPRVCSVRKRAGEEQVLAEYIVEHEVKIPKRMTREDVIERTYVVPERVVVEEIVEENTKIVERVIEVAQPIVMEKIVEVPEIEYVEKIVEVPQKITREKVREVPKVTYEERIIEVPKLVPREKIVNVPVYEYHEFPVEKIVEVPQVHEQVVIKEVPIPQYVDKPVPEERTVQIDKEVPRITPVPVEAVTTLSLTLPRIRSVWKQHKVPVYVPRFVEIPVVAELCNEQLLDEAHRCVNEVTKLMAASQVEPLSACKLEECAGFVQNFEFADLIGKQSSLENFAHWWMTNQLQIDEGSLQSICQTLESDNTVFTEAVSLIKPRSAGSKTAATTVTATTSTSGHYPYVGGGSIIRISETPSSAPGPLELTTPSDLHTEVSQNAMQQIISTSHMQSVIAAPSAAQLQSVIAAPSPAQLHSVIAAPSAAQLHPVIPAPSTNHLQAVPQASAIQLQGASSNMAVDPKTGHAMLLVNRQVLQPTFPNMSVLRSAELLNSPLDPVGNRPPPELGSNSSVLSDVKCVAADNPMDDQHHSSEASDDDEYSKVELLDDGPQRLDDQLSNNVRISAETGRLIQREIQRYQHPSVETSVEQRSVEQRSVDRRSADRCSADRGSVDQRSVDHPRKPSTKDQSRSIDTEDRDGEEGQCLVEDCVENGGKRQEAPVGLTTTDVTPPLRATSIDEDGEDESLTKETPVSSPDEEELPLISTLNEKTSEEADYDDEEEEEDEEEEVEEEDATYRRGQLTNFL